MEVNENSWQFVQDGDTYNVIFKEDFHLAGDGRMGLDFYQPDGKNWMGNGWLNANFNLSNDNGARILEMNPRVDFTTIIQGGGSRYEQINVSINGAGVIPGSAYTIARVVPEPATMGLLGIGGFVTAFAARRNRRRTSPLELNRTLMT